MIYFLLFYGRCFLSFFFFFQAEDGIRDVAVTGVQTCALPICRRSCSPPRRPPPAVLAMRCSSCWRSVAVADAVRIATPLADAPRPATLTQRASLNVVASLLDYGAKVAVGLVVVPILVGGLGRSLYGVWEMLGR